VLSTLANDAVLEFARQRLESPRERDMLERFLRPGVPFYVEKLKRLNFVGHKRVLDAGSGFGQWTLALAELNEKVFAVEFDHRRSMIARELSLAHKGNVRGFTTGSIEALPFQAAEFDAVYCFSVVYFTDYRRSFAECFRVLRPGGKLYLCTNGLGWCLFNLIKNHNPSADFSPRGYAVSTTLHSLRYWLTGRRVAGKHLIMSPRGTARALRDAGFTDVELLRQGGSTGSPIGIYASKYLGLPNVFEMIAVRP
jgi:SAM-dependent methyltransferase